MLFRPSPLHFGLPSMTLAFLFSLSLTSWAQTTSLPADDIQRDIFCAASNHRPYPAPEADAVETPAPDGYSPFYVSTYMRHGSRYFIDQGEYLRPLRTLQEADSLGLLTPTGREVLAAVDSMWRISQNRLGELSALGAKQHRGIARRMAARCPEAFAAGAHVEARSTDVPRCILSMANELAVLAATFPDIDISLNASRAYKPVLNNEESRYTSFRSEPAARAAVEEVRRNLPPYGRFAAQLFTDTAAAHQLMSFTALRSSLFYLAGGEANHGVEFDLYRLFAPEELRALWRAVNYDWYVNYGPSPLTRSLVPYAQLPLLADIVKRADSVIAARGCGADLRFGHEVALLPLACLMEIGFAGYTTESADSVAAHWQAYDIFPMGGNIQLVFYRNGEDEDNEEEVLVKALLNEREVSLPVTTDRHPYYRWDDLRNYYQTKLNEHNPM